MIASATVYSGLTLAALAAVATLFKRLRRRGLAAFAIGMVLTAVGFGWPSPERRAAAATTQLDRFAPRWQFHEHHSIRIAAPPERVDAAIRRVRAGEIALFRLLTWVRRGGRPLPEGVLNPGNERPILEVATRGGFVLLANEPAREIVIGTVLFAPPGAPGRPNRGTFERDLPPGWAVATMNFLMVPDGTGGTRLTTETRIFASDDAARHRFAVYWRVIYPGSALIRRMWLRAIRDRAEGKTAPAAA